MVYTVHGILQARILEWVAFPFSRGFSQESNWGLLRCRWILYQLSYQGSPQLPLIREIKMRADSAVQIKVKTLAFMWSEMGDHWTRSPWLLR